MRKPEVSHIQRASTHNIFQLKWSEGEINLRTNIDSPDLHFHIGTINKIVKAIDIIVKLWEEKNDTG